MSVSLMSVGHPFCLVPNPREDRCLWSGKAAGMSRTLGATCGYFLHL